MWPIIAYGAITAGSMLASYLSSEEAKKLSAAERRKLEEALSKIKSPNFRPTDLTPEELKVGEKYYNKMEAYVKEKEPQLYAMTAQANVGRQARMNALNRLQELSGTEAEVKDREMMNIAGSNAAAMQGATRDATLREEFANRGVQRGAGAELMLRAIAQDQARQAAAKNSMQAYQEARRSALNSMLNAAGQGESIERDETNMMRGNTNIINDWNQRLSANQQALERRNVNRQNEAESMNWNRANTVNDTNTSLRNKYAVDNLNRYNDMEQQKYNNEMAKYGKEVSQTQMKREEIAASNKQKQDMIAGIGQAATSAVNYGVNYKPSRASDVYAEPETKTQFNVGQQDEYQDAEDEEIRNKKYKPGYNPY